MKKGLIWASGLLFMLTGCMELEEKISIGKDGSGYYEAKFVLSKEFTSMLQSDLKRDTLKSDLPMSMEQLERTFQGEGIKIVNSSFDIVKERLVCNYRIAFQNATVFFAVPGMSNRLRFYQQGDRLVLKSLTQSNVKPGGAQFPGSAGTGFPGGTAATAEDQEISKQMEEMQAALQESMKAFLKGLKISISLELPNKILDSNATHVQGRLARWVIDENTLANMGKGMSLPDSLWASCSLEALTFRPPTEKAVLKALAPQPVRVASPAPEAPPKPVALKPKREGPPAGQLPDSLAKGGRSLITLKNGNIMKVDGFRKEGDMLSLRKYGGTISLPISSIETVRLLERR